jgi:hypothetical protein
MTDNIIPFDLHFWDGAEGARRKSKWTTNCPYESRKVFERKLTELVGAAIPENLEYLRQQYSLFNWSERPKDAVNDLHSAVIFGCFEEDPDNDEVITQLYCCVNKALCEQSFSVDRVDKLICFVRELKYQALLTIFRFQQAQHNFLRSLPSRVTSSLNYVLFDIALSLLMDLLRLTNC